MVLTRKYWGVLPMFAWTNSGTGTMWLIVDIHIEIVGMSQCSSKKTLYHIIPITSFFWKLQITLEKNRHIIKIMGCHSDFEVPWSRRLDRCGKPMVPRLENDQIYVHSGFSTSLWCVDRRVYFHTSHFSPQKCGHTEGFLRQVLKPGV